jgi:hypothetical protein
LGDKVAIGENLRCKVEVRNFAKALANAADITLVITNPAGTKVADIVFAGITHESLGVYYYSYKPAAAAIKGTYTALWDVTLSGEHRRSRGYFVVTE